jgi:hypothetical protein
MTNKIALLIIYQLPVIYCYLFSALIAWSFDPATWSWTLRIITVVVIVLFWINITAWAVKGGKKHE